MKTLVAVIGLLILGAAGWTMFGDSITYKAEEVKEDVQYKVHDHAQEVVDSIRPQGRP